MNDLYREEILEHYREPLNFGRPDTFNTSSKQTNPFCGDEIEMFLQWGKRDIGDKGDRRVKALHFVGSGCAISISAGSLLTDFARGKTKKELTSFSQNDMLNLLKVEVSETRKKCALLALVVLKDCLKRKEYA